MPVAVLCHHFLAGGAIGVTPTDTLRDGSTDREVKLAAGDLMRLVAVRNKTLVQVLPHERNTPVVRSEQTRGLKFKHVRTI